MKSFNGKVDVRAGRGEWQILFAGILNVCHNLISLINFTSNFSSLCFENLQVVDDIIVIKDPSFGLIEAR